MSEYLPPLIQTSLKLTPEVLNNMAEWLCKRHDGVRTEMGFGADGKACGNSWLRKREEAWAEYENDFAHRTAHPKYGQLYSVFNNSMNVPKRAVRVYKAKACEGILNSDPFAGFMPEGKEDENPGIPPAERYWLHKVDQAEGRFHLREGIEQAAVSGDCVIKTTAQPSDEEEDLEDDEADASVWVNLSGEPILDTQGQQIFEDEEWEDDKYSLDEKVLKRDSNVRIKKDQLAKSAEKLPRPKRVPVKLDIKGLGYKDFLCSPLAADIHTTDFIAHEYDLSINDLLKMLGPKGLTDGVKAWLKEIKDAGGDEGAGSSQNVERRGEKEQGKDASPKLRVCEAWFSYALEEWGLAQELCCLFHPKSKRVIFVELMKKASATRQRPFEALRIIPVKDRWYGMGFYELLSNEHNFIDRQWTRIDARSSQSGRFTWKRENVIVEEMLGIAPVTLNSPRIWTVNQNLEPGEQPINHVELPAMDEKLWDLLNMAMQQATLATGTMTPGDAAASGLNPSETATGQEMLAAESDLMSNDSTQDLSRGITAVLKQSVMAVFNTYDEREAGEMLGADDAEKLNTWLADHKPRKFLNHVRLLLTKKRGKQRVEASEKVLNVVKDYLTIVQQFPQMAEQLKPIYVSILQGLDVPNADTALSIPPAQLSLVQPPANVDPAASQPTVPQAPPSALPPGAAVAA